MPRKLADIRSGHRGNRSFHVNNPCQCNPVMCLCDFGRIAASSFCKPSLPLHAQRLPMPERTDVEILHIDRATEFADLRERY